MKKIGSKAVVFDWDGTLVDTLPMKVQNAGRVFQDILHCDAQAVEQAYRQYSGIPRRELFEAIVAAVGEQGLSDRLYEQLSKKFSALNREVVSPDSVFPGVPQTLSALAELSFLLFVSSAATPEDVSHSVSVTGLAHHFHEVLGSQNEFSKGRGHLNYICARYGLRSDQVCVIGDEPADIRLAKEAGTWAVAKEGTLNREQIKATEPDAVISEINELLDLLVIVTKERIDS